VRSRIGAADAESALRAALKDRVHFVRAEAATSLGKIHAKPAVPDLIDLARRDRFRPARAAAQAVGEIDPRTLIKTAASPDAGMPPPRGGRPGRAMSAPETFLRIWHGSR
jgi:hypothetical protein